MTMPWGLLAAAAVCLAVWLVLRSSRPKLPAGFPEGEVVYRSHGRTRSRTLYAERYGLCGRPDYIVRRNDEYLPVEVKSGVKSRRLYPSDRMQLVAEALLVEGEYGKRPKRGYVVYHDGLREVTIRPKDIDKLSRTVRLMQAAKRIGDLPDVPASWYYCPTCPKTRCPMRSERQDRRRAQNPRRRSRRRRT